MGKRSTAHAAVSLRVDKGGEGTINGGHYADNA
jgi:hypothetical protein